MKTKFTDSEYRKAFVKQNIFSSIAHQVKIIREHRGWSQKDLAEKLGTKQSAVSRLEDPAYGKYTLSTLFKIAEVFDVGLQIQFVSWSKLTKEVDEWSPEKALKLPYKDEMAELNKTAVTTDTLSHTYSLVRKEVVLLHYAEAFRGPLMSLNLNECLVGADFNSKPARSIERPSTAEINTSVH